MKRVVIFFGRFYINKMLEIKLEKQDTFVLFYSIHGIIIFLHNVFHKINVCVLYFTFVLIVLTKLLLM